VTVLSKIVVSFNKIVDSFDGGLFEAKISERVEQLSIDIKLSSMLSVITTCLSQAEILKDQDRTDMFEGQFSFFRNA